MPDFNAATHLNLPNEPDVDTATDTILERVRNFWNNANYKEAEQELNHLLNKLQESPTRRWDLYGRTMGWRGALRLDFQQQSAGRNDLTSALDILNSTPLVG